MKPQGVNDVGNLRLSLIDEDTPKENSSSVGGSQAVSPVTVVEMYPNLDKTVLVIGGLGFLGSHIAEFMVNRGARVRVMDVVVPRSPHPRPGFHHHHHHRGVPTSTSFAWKKLSHLGCDFFGGTVTNLQDLRLAMQGVDVVFHTASLTDPLRSRAELYAVNVKGTQNVITACLEAGVSELIYTSSTAVVDDGTDLNGIDETRKYPKVHLDYYGKTKAEAEQLVLQSNGKVSNAGPLGSAVTLKTCSLRPHAVFGPRDTHFVAQLIAKVKGGVLTHIIGDGRNLADFTFIDNIVYAHYLAALKLQDPQSPVAGQAYFITNDEPTPFWAFIGRLLTEFGSPRPERRISFAFAYLLAWFMELLRWFLSWLPLVNYRPSITRHLVCTVAKHHWFSCERAKKDLGYSPLVSLEDGLQITVEYFAQQRAANDEDNLNED
jgi:sterol-4alpha-carboxylate 3-dehydrogenase (decarboxylating)